MDGGGAVRCGRVDSGSEVMGARWRGGCGTGDGRGKSSSSSSSKHAGKCYGDLRSEGEAGRSSNSRAAQHAAGERA